MIVVCYCTKKSCTKQPLLRFSLSIIPLNDLNHFASGEDTIELLFDCTFLFYTLNLHTIKLQKQVEEVVAVLAGGGFHVEFHHEKACWVCGRVEA